MAKAPFINVVGTRCHIDDEAKFNKWYDEVHIPLLLKFKGLKKVTRYKAASPSDQYPAYLTIYEFNSKKDFDAFQQSKELAEVRKEQADTWKSRNFEMVWRMQYEPHKVWER